MSVPCSSVFHLSTSFIVGSMREYPLTPLGFRTLEKTDRSAQSPLGDPFGLAPLESRRRPVPLLGVFDQLLL